MQTVGGGTYVERRNFISTLIGAAAVAGLPLPKSAEDRFNESLYQRLPEKKKQG
jgi:hypothetical protein